MTREGLQARLGYPVDDDTYASITRIPRPALQTLESAMNDLVKMLVPVIASLDRGRYSFEFPHPAIWIFSRGEITLTLFLDSHEIKVNFQRAEMLEMLEFDINNYGRLQFHSWYEEVLDETI